VVLCRRRRNRLDRSVRRRTKWLKQSSKNDNS
jgi:hypothetical protein